MLKSAGGLGFYKSLKTLILTAVSYDQEKSPLVADSLNGINVCLLQ
jgi:hypothetical protein